MAVVSTDSSTTGVPIKLILYFADGFSWQYVEDRPFMPEFWQERRPLQTLVGYSSTIIPSILTGRYPQETGMWTEYYLEPRKRSSLQRLLTRPRLRWTLFPVNILRLVWFRIARRAGLGIEHRLRLPLELSHLFSRHPIKYDQFPPIGLPVRSLADMFKERGLSVDFRYIAGALDPAAELDHLRMTAAEHDVFFYYDPSLDGMGHRVGASADALAHPIERIASFLKDATGQLENEGDTHVLLFSDHGMTTVRSTFDLLGHLSEFKLGTDYIAFIDSTLARFWFPDEERRTRILASLADVPGTVLSDEQREKYGIAFSDRRYAQDVLVADEGVVLHPNYFAGPFLRFARKYPELAMHGYLPEAPSSQGIFFHRGAALEAPLPDPFSATDIFAVVDAITKR
jgi:hypothetical protein